MGVYHEIDRRFAVEARGSNLRTELIGGATTYMTLAYIVFVQPVVLSAAGMDFGAVLMATCLGSAVACFLMAFLANYPIALAPGMGQNFYFALTVVVGMGVAWQTALAAVFVAGVLFVVLSLAGIRRQVIDSLPSSLMNAIGCGIGLMISLVGLEWSGIIVAKPGTYVGLGSLSSPPVLLALFGLAVTSALLVRRVPGAILMGILATTIVGLLAGLIHCEGVASAPPSIEPTLLKLDLRGLWSLDMLSVVAVFLFLDVFDTIGTLVGVAPEAGLIKDGKIDISTNALLADAGGTVVGALLGTSTITSYVESAAGIQSGARTGIAAVVTGLLLLITPFFSPLVTMVGGGIAVSETLKLYPVTAPALIIVGVMMMKPSVKINWSDPSEAIPAFLTIVMMPLTVSITDGIAFGLISYSALSVVGGTAGKVPWPLHLCAILLGLRYVFAG
ncbi:MAG: NCS2 family permease [Thermodesulfobacteriota bacterium]